MSFVGKPRVLPLFALKRALERWYRGVTVEICERRIYPDMDGLSLKFNAENAEVLIAHGLARRHPRIPTELLPVGTEVEGGGEEWGDRSYVIHHSYDGEPSMPGTRQYPPKKTVVDVERITRRMLKATRPIPPKR